MSRHLEDDIYTNAAVDPPVVRHGSMAGEKKGSPPLRLGQAPPIRIGPPPKDPRRTLGPGDADGTEADRPQPKDRHGVVFQRSRQSRVDGIPEWLLQGGDFGAEPRRVTPAIFGRQEHVARERSVAIDAEDPHVLAQMVEAALALPAGVVDDMSFRRNIGPRFNFSNVGTNGDDPAGHLVPEDPGRADMAPGPVIPIEDVDVGTTDGRRGHLDQNILAGWLGDGNLIDLRAPAGCGLQP